MTPAPRIEAESYDDEGCELHPACLECPLPVCQYDGPKAYTKLHTHRDRDIRIFELIKAGVPPADIRRTFSVSFRHIQRVRQRGGPSQSAVGNAEDWGLDESPKISPLSFPQRIKAREPWPEMMR